MRRAWLAVIFATTALRVEAQLPTSPASSEAVRKSYAEVEACNRKAIAADLMVYCQTSSFEAWAPIGRIKDGVRHLEEWQKLARTQSVVSCDKAMCTVYSSLPTAVPDIAACTVVSVGGRRGPPFECRHVAVKLQDGWWLEGVVEKRYTTERIVVNTSVNLGSAVTLVAPRRLPRGAFDAAVPYKIRTALVREMERSLRVKWHLATEVWPSGAPDSVHGVSGKRPSILLAPYREDIGVSIFVDVREGAAQEMVTSNERRYRTKPVSVGQTVMSHRDRRLLDALNSDRRSEIRIDAIMDIDVSRYATDDVTKWHAVTGAQLRTMREALGRMVQEAVRSGCTAAGLVVREDASNRWTCSYRRVPPPRR